LLSFPDKTKLDHGQIYDLWQYGRATAAQLREIFNKSMFNVQYTMNPTKNIDY
jgi:hypothetical protein